MPKFEDIPQWYLDMNTGGSIHTDYEINKVRQLIRKEKKYANSYSK
ncbi:MAG: hypothetical protein PVG65_02720 [Candidatus Thorarchaeota archaeon]|jgi:hypothetical protein